VTVSGNYTSIIKKDVCNEQDGSVTNTIVTIPSVTDPVLATGSDPIRGSFGADVPNTTPAPNNPPPSYSTRGDLGAGNSSDGLGYNGYFGS
jgi:hypothetical protein